MYLAATEGHPQSLTDRTFDDLDDLKRNDRPFVIGAESRTWEETSMHSAQRIAGRSDAGIVVHGRAFGIRSTACRRQDVQLQADEGIQVKLPGELDR